MRQTKLEKAEQAAEAHRESNCHLCHRMVAEPHNLDATCPIYLELVRACRMASRTTKRR